MLSRLRGRLAPYYLVLPGGLWLLLFFVVPMVWMVKLSLSEGSVVGGFHLTWHWQTYTDTLDQYRPHILRSLWYGFLTTIIQIVIAFPIAYYIAFRAAARNKSTYLFILLLPFFVSFVLRTISWRFMLTDNGIILGPLKEWGLLDDRFHVLGTAPAVVFGLTYNFLPFMVLPIYVALERIDPRVMEAARDLYAGPVQVQRKVVFPLALPGIFAGVLMTFVPASSDYVNAELLGSANTTMIGQIVQAKYLEQSSYPTASAISFALMAILLIGIFIYARILGTEDVLKVAAR